MAIEKPNYTQVPNSLFELMPLMGDAEMRCTLALVRKILGYHKTDDLVSYSQLMKTTGLTRQGVRNGLKSALERKTVRVVGVGKQGIKRYTLNFVGDESELVNAVDQSTTLTKTSQPRRHTKEKKESNDPSGSLQKAKKRTQRKKRDTIPASRMNPMKDAIVAVFKWNWDTMNDSEEGQVQRAAKLLCQSNVLPDMIPNLYAYCEKQFTQFKPGALPANVQQWSKTLVSPDAAQPQTSTSAIREGVLHG